LKKLIIEDGTGSGRKAAVNTDHFLQTLAQTFPYEHYINHRQKGAYSIIFDVTPTGAGDCIFYIKNTNDIDMIINNITLQSQSQEAIELTLGDLGTPVGGTDYVPVNRTSGAANTSDCISQYGTDITGLTKGGVIEKLYCTSGASQSYLWLSDFILPKNTTFAIYAVNGSIRITISLSMYYHDSYSHN
jgi:hypothetical protein